jgi:hypothetical protein
MVMDFIDGVPYPYLDIDQDDTMRVTKLYEQICRIAFDLSKLRFHQIGSILNAQDPTASFGPKIWDDIECAPFHNPHDYYKALANHYWNEAISSIAPEISTVITRKLDLENCTVLRAESFHRHFTRRVFTSNRLGTSWYRVLSSTSGF